MVKIKKYYETIINDNLKEFIELEKTYGLDIFLEEDISIIAECASYNAIKICDYLYKKGMSLDMVSNPFQYNALYNSILHGNLSLAKWLLLNKANPNGNILANGTPIDVALYNLGKILLEIAFDPKHPKKKINLDNKELQEKLKNTAEYQEYKEIIELLLNNGADPNIIIPSLCKTALDTCYSYCYKEIETLLLKYNAVSARKNIDFTNSNNASILQYLQNNVGQILNTEFNSNRIQDITLRLALIEKNSKLKLLFTDGLYKSDSMCELMMCLDSYIAVNQQLIDSDNPYNFFMNVLLDISHNITTNKITPYEGMIFDQICLPNIKFPKNIDGLMLIDYQLSEDDNIFEYTNNVTLWLLLPFRYPKTGKFNAQTLEKFIKKYKTAKWDKVAYLLEKGEMGGYLPIFENTIRENN
ncbi:ankyrin repeat domain-containing protein [Avibacterium endocarditidis]|uniref:ankyrin repeat domain-containing protein n=3 Tax=Pasteurellaceae TaxID=712 RepID=UPI0039FD125A